MRAPGCCAAYAQNAVHHVDVAHSQLLCTNCPFPTSLVTSSFATSTSALQSFTAIVMLDDTSTAAQYSCLELHYSISTGSLSGLKPF